MRFSAGSTAVFIRWSSTSVMNGCDIRTPEGVRIRIRLFGHYEQAAAAGDLAALFHEDLAFHRMIWAAADNPYAVRALETMMGSLFASGLIGSRDRQSIDLLAEFAKHARLFDAIRDHDPQRAALALLEIAAGFEKQLQASDTR